MPANRSANRPANRSAPQTPITPHLIHEDVDAHHERVRAAGARVLSPPTTHPFGERQYTAEDPEGQRWSFSQSVEDVAPETWGASTSRAGGPE